MFSDNFVKPLNNKQENPNGQYVLYWVQNAPRVEFNQALAYSIDNANRLGVTVKVVFLVNPKFPNANLRHLNFLIEGLDDFRGSLNSIKLDLLVLNSLKDGGKFTKLVNEACMLITDKGYLKYYKKRVKGVVDTCTVKLIEVETNLIVPVEKASNKQEYGAYTIRPKLEKLLDDYLIPFNLPAIKIYNKKESLESVDFKAFLQNNCIDSSVPTSTTFIGGESVANTILVKFVKEKISSYSEKRNDPSLDFQSNLSPYLHFGFISPLKIVLYINKTYPEFKKDFFNELIVWRELAHNFCYYNNNYDSIKCLPEWAKKTLNEHKTDERVYLYTLSELESGNTHDIYWNAAQLEMVKTGKMHGYMRMYWGKKVLEWTKTPKQAYEILLYLNNKYELDGRDPNGYAGVAWCFGLHDRPWFEREIFGKVRYMAESGLKRKFDIDLYVEEIKKLSNT